MPPLRHELFRWRWHHFQPTAKADNYLPILGVLGEHEGEAIKEARDGVNEGVDRLGLGVGLGRREGHQHTDILRNRTDVWRFSGALFEPGLVEDRIQLTELGRALLEGIAPFDEAMTRQALRLSFPRVRVGESSRLEKAVDQLSEALSVGPGVSVVRAWVVAAGHLRARGESSDISGPEAARFLSGATRMEEIPDRAERLGQHRMGLPCGYPEPGSAERRQGGEIKRWLEANGVLVSSSQRAVTLDPSDRYFAFEDGSVDEMMRWSRWWGSWPPPAT